MSDSALRPPKIPERTNAEKNRIARLHLKKLAYGAWLLTDPLSFDKLYLPVTVGGFNQVFQHFSGIRTWRDAFIMFLCVVGAYLLGLLIAFLRNLVVASSAICEGYSAKVSQLEADLKGALLKSTPIPLTITIPKPWGVGGWTGDRRIYFHLDVHNPSKIPADDCKVFIEKITMAIQTEDGEKWRVEPQSHRLQLAWTPWEANDRPHRIVDHSTFDLGYINGHNLSFSPRFLQQNLYNGAFRQVGKFRYYISVVGSFTAGPHDARIFQNNPTVVQVSWDGRVDEEKMDSHFVGIFVDYDAAESETI